MSTWPKSEYSQPYGPVMRQWRPVQFLVRRCQYPRRSELAIDAFLHLIRRPLDSKSQAPKLALQVREELLGELE